MATNNSILPTPLGDSLREIAGLIDGVPSLSEAIPFSEGIDVRVMVRTVSTVETLHGIHGGLLAYRDDGSAELFVQRGRARLVVSAHASYVKPLRRHADVTERIEATS